MSRQETYENLCVLLEEYADADVETVADQIMAMLGLTGEDLLEAMDPPTGLRTWLVSHGLSLVPTTEARAPRVWDALESTGEQEDSDLEGEQGVTVSPPLQVGDYVEYRTAPSGRDHAQQIGAGWVKEILRGGFWIRTGGPDVYIAPGEGDVIQLVRPAAPGPTHPQSVQAPPS
jgi:hypothetical protein